jgi:hypothetical protein
MIEIHAELQRLSGLMHDAGYVPCTEFVLDDVEEEMVFHLHHHIKKLPIAFELINTAPDIPLQIRKNLRIYKDCRTSRVHLKNSWESNHGEGCHSLSSL